MTFLERFQIELGSNWTGATTSPCKTQQAASLKKDLLKSFEIRGIVTNTKLTLLELQQFRSALNLLKARPNDFGVSVKTIVRTMEDMRLFPSKVEAYRICGILCPSCDKDSLISFDDFVSGSTNPAIHHRHKLFQFVKLLPGYVSKR
jgi:hypothetical protein